MELRTSAVPVECDTYAIHREPDRHPGTVGLAWWHEPP